MKVDIKLGNKALCKHFICSPKLGIYSQTARTRIKFYCYTVLHRFQSGFNDHTFRYSMGELHTQKFIHPRRNKKHSDKCNT